MAWKAYLRGHDQDLRTLRREFASGDPKVSENESGTFLESPRLDGSPGDHVALSKDAAELLVAINAAARMLEASYQPVELVNRFEDETGAFTAILVSDTLTIREEVAITVSGRVDGPSAAPTLPGPDLAAASLRDPQLREAVGWVVAPQVTWADLYKAKEVITGAVPDLVARGWCTKAELSAFGASANLPQVSGRDARHARHSAGAPRRSMTHPEGLTFIMRLLRYWAESVT
jgi:hypothetical protein